MNIDYRLITELDMKSQKELLATCKRILSTLPDGSVKVSTINKKPYPYYKQAEDSSFQLVRKNNSTDARLFQQISLRKWMEEVIETVEQNLSAQQIMLDEYKSYDLESIKGEMQPACQLMEVDFVKKAIRKGTPPSDFKQSENPYFRENLVHRTSFGLLVRSKSERFIAEMLYAAGIPFLYEPEVKLLAPDGREYTFYPDFLVWDAAGEFYYWEHLGKFMDAAYRSKNEEKFLIYFLCNVTIGTNLILTCDNKDGALDPEAVRKYIRWLK